MRAEGLNGGAPIQILASSPYNMQWLIFAEMLLRAPTLEHPTGAEGSLPMMETAPGRVDQRAVELFRVPVAITLTSRGPPI